MKTVTLLLSDELAARMEETAKARNCSIEELLALYQETFHGHLLLKAKQQSIIEQIRSELKHMPHEDPEEMKDWEATLMDGLENK